jgi:DNA-directed RNA polymerase subunit beta'
MPTPSYQDVLKKLSDLDASTRSNVLMNETVKNTVEKILSSVEDPNIKLQINNIWYKQKYDNNDISAQQSVRNKHQSWTDDIRADVSLIDKLTGKIIDRNKDLKITSVPKLTPRNTYLLGGNEYSFTKQSRLKPGVYTRRQENGEISSFFNVDKTIDFDRGYNNNFKLNFNPERKTFTMGYGSKNVPLYNALRAVGVKDEDLNDKWGKDVVEANRQAYEKHEFRDQSKLYEAIFGKSPLASLTHDQLKKEIKDRLFATKLSPETTKLTLGKEYDGVNTDVLLDASKKIIDIHKGEVEGDDRESLLFKSFYDVEDHVRENLVKKSKNIIGTLTYKLGKTKNINKSISSSFFDPYVVGTITQNMLSSPPSQVNIMSMIGDGNKVTVMGEGGIGNQNAVTNQVRQISNSEAGFIDPLHTPEGGNIGITNHLTLNTIKVGNDLFSSFIKKNGEKVHLRPVDTHQMNIAFPDQYDLSGKIPKPLSSKIKILNQGKFKEIKPDEVDAIIASSANLFDHSANMIPFLDSIQGNRGLTASKMQEQALSLKHRDKLLFNIVNEKGKSLNEALGRISPTPRSPVDGEVISVSPNQITIVDKRGNKNKIQLYNNFSLNAEGFIHNESVVKVGDIVKKDQLLADNNNTREGQLALGTNLKVAYMPYKGYNYEDSAIMSESAANKLTSEHIYDFSSKRSANGIFSKNKFRAYYPEVMTGKQAGKLDADGVVQIGQELDNGDTIIAHLERKPPTADDIALGRLEKQLRRDMANNAVTWDNDHKGVVTNVEKHGNTVTVSVKTEEPLKIADKISGLHGNKHIISKIVPDEEMPLNPTTGERIDLTMSPLGVSNRINTSQLLEAAAGKIATKTGKQYEIKNFAITDNTERVLNDLKKEGLSDKDILIDPETNKPFKNPIMNGVAHILKLEHKVDHKFSARYRDGHDSNEQAITGGVSGGKNLGRMEVGALLARGATENLKEMYNIKGQKNNEYWKALETGQMLPPPAPSFVWNKQLAMMKGAGINVIQKGKQLNLKPLTDDEIKELSNGKLDNPTDTYRKKDLAPIKGGLFDPVKAGGMQGEHYTHFELPEKILNPITATAAATMLDMPLDGLESIINGKSFVDKDSGKIVKPGTPNSFSGGPAVEKLLSQINVNKELEKLQSDATVITNKTQLNKVHRKLRYLKALKENKMQPTDYMIKNVLVVPSKYRPMFTMGTDNTVIMSDVNDLYQQTAYTSDALKDLKITLDETIKDDNIKNIQLAESRGQLYQDVKALSGLREPTAYLHRIKDKKGFVSQIDGGKKQTKEGFFQDKVLERRQDLVGRSTIILNPELGGDQLGIPKLMANKIFQPFIMKKLVSWGYSPLEAQKQIEDDTAVFQRARQVVADERLVIANRAPTLHRWNMTAFKPVLTDGKSIEVPGLVVSKNFGGDFDGDTFQLHVPVGSKALEEAKRMTPSSSMLKTGYDTVLNKPDMDMVIGSWLMSKGKGGEHTDLKYNSIDDARKDFRQHKFTYADTITIDGKKVPFGIHEINSVLPEDMRKYDIELTSKNIEDWIKDVTNKHSGNTGLILADKIKDIGNNYSTTYGYSLGLEDTKTIKDIRDPLIAEANRKVDKKDPLSIIKEYSNAKNKMSSQIKDTLSENHPLMIGAMSGGSKDKISEGFIQSSQIIGMPGIVLDAEDKPIPMPITKSYSEGLDTSSYWAAAHGARGGNIKKSIQSYKPGWMTKDLMNSIYDTRIYNDAPVDIEGIEYNIDNRKHVMNRYLARDIKDSKGKIIAKRNDVINDQLISKLNKMKINSVFIQSPLSDPTPGDGISSWSYGVEYDGKRLKPGDHIGVMSAHTITEPSLNMAMKSFHTGGAITGKEKNTKGTLFDALDRTLRFTQAVPNKATMASIDAKVKSINKSSIGGWDVILQHSDGQEETRYIEPNNTPTIKVGDKVKKGDVISTGNISMHDVLKYKGMKDTQKFLVDELDKLNEGKLDRRNLEVIVRGIANTTRVMHSGDSNYVMGDTAPLTTINDFNNHLTLEKDVEESEGMKLHKPYAGYNSGTKLDKSTIKHLQNKGIKRIEVTRNPIIHDPFLSPAGIGGKVASSSEDWIARMAHNRIEAVLKEGTTQGWHSSFDNPNTNHPLSLLVTNKM